MEQTTFLPDYVVNTSTPVITLSENLTWNITDYGIPDLHDKGYLGQGIKVAILDTGIADHPDLNIVEAFDMTKTGVHDEHGHGTHVAGIISALMNEQGIRGCAPSTEIYPIKVTSSKTGSIKDLIDGIDKAIELGVDIINMSLGTEADIPQLKAACARASAAGILLICASGNTGTESISYPGAYEYCVAVGSVNRQKQSSAFTSFGQPLDVMAPGEKILSTYLNNGYAVLSGTSMATPWITGVSALLMSAGVKVNYELMTTCVMDMQEPGFDPQTGYGIFDPKKALLTLVGEGGDTYSDQILQRIDGIETMLTDIREILTGSSK